MTEGEFNSCTDPERMLEWLRGTGQASERKLRMFAVACCRRIWGLLPEGHARRVVEVAESFADHATDEQALAAAEEAAAAEATEVSHAWEADQGNEQLFAKAAACWASLESAYNYGPRWVLSRYRECTRHGKAFAAAGRSAGRSAYAARVAAYAVSNDCQAADRAEADERMTQATLLRCIFGPLPFRQVVLGPSLLGWNGGLVVNLAQSIHDERAWDRLPVLADALEEAGCREPGLLFHCRQHGCVHIRGCWVVDLLLNKA